MTRREKREEVEGEGGTTAAAGAQRGTTGASGRAWCAARRSAPGSGGTCRRRTRCPRPPTWSSTAGRAWTLSTTSAASATRRSPGPAPASMPTPRQGGSRKCLLKILLCNAYFMKVSRVVPRFSISVCNFTEGNLLI